MNRCTVLSARWLAYVTEGCFKYVTHGLSERLRVGGRSTGIDREHITWFSFEGEFFAGKAA